MLFAQHCHGDGSDTFGLLNVGISPVLPAAWTVEMVFLELCDLVDQISVPFSSSPLVPPPKPLSPQVQN
jgi:hypothetical protein